MAWMKVEALAHRNAATRPTIAVRLAAHAHELLSLGARVRPLAAATARLAGRPVGRALPAPARRWRPPRHSGAGPPMVLMADTFTRFLHPEIGDAALEVLSAHARVQVVSPGCCGRPMLSMGFVEGARRRARRMLDRLAPHALAGTPIVVLEPSCWSMLVDDVPKLLPGDPRAGWVAGAARSFERMAQELDLGISADESTLVHPHCHARALGEDDAILGLVDGAVDPGAGCCGMAGAFGYRHPDVSRRVADSTLAPAARRADRVVASGTSCRQQIAELTGKRALHPAEALLARRREPTRA
jgi:Fe-S oxidoreductase